MRHLTTWLAVAVLTVVLAGCGNSTTQKVDAVPDAEPDTQSVDLDASD